MSISRRTSRNFSSPTFSFSNSIDNWKPPDWFPSAIRKRQELRQRWPPYKEETKTEIIKVVKVEQNKEENGKLHHTSKYGSMIDESSSKLVIRRGQEFSIWVHFDRKFNKDRDAISFLFTIADGKPSMNHGTLITVPLLQRTSDYWNSTPWTAFSQKIIENKIHVFLKFSVKCPIGAWDVAIDSKLIERSKEDLASYSYKCKDPFYVLFNPWNKDDLVYMEDSELLNEYILEDSGLIWRGTHSRIRPTPWSYAQFEEDILETAVYLLNGPGRLLPPSRGDPVKVTRAISAAVNSTDDGGVLEGNWTDKFDGGTSPTKWMGSLKILTKYYDSKKPVKYAQCWVFAGVLTTIARTLGIPCRPVTNYSSAHDTQCSLTIDIFFDDDGKEVEKLNTDSVWNFHVWNEVWMKRLDLESVDSKVEKYGGWQVIDATPQEQSDEIYCCGPTSVAAIKRGEILKPYDASFVYSEVNADKVYWHYRGKGTPLKLLEKKSDSIGLFISTKMAGKFEREDITENYKHPENSEEERESMLTALKQSESLYSRYYLNEDFNDVRFDLELLDDLLIGSEFEVRFLMNNVSKNKEYKVQGTLRADTMIYTGKIKGQVKKTPFSIVIPPLTEKEVTMLVSYHDYSTKLCEQCSFNIACLAKVRGTSYEYFAQDDFRLRNPDIKFKIPLADDDKILVGEEFSGTLFFKNPLPEKLTNCEFQLESPGITAPIKIKIKHSVGPGEYCKGEFKLTAKTEGDKTITAKFTSSKLKDIDGMVTIAVHPDTKLNELY